MKIRERALTSTINSIEIRNGHDIIVKRLTPPLIEVRYFPESNTGELLSFDTGSIEQKIVSQKDIDNAVRKAIAFAKNNIIYDNGRSI
jgi:hypothetical protein